MPDLSDVLGDVYSGVYGGGSSAPPPASEPEVEDAITTKRDAEAEADNDDNDDNDETNAPSSRANDAPAWADESRLDAAFATWRPGPDRNAPAAERKLFGEAALAPVAPRDEAPPRPPRPLDGDMADALSEALAPAAPVVSDYASGASALSDYTLATPAGQPAVTDFEPAPPPVLGAAGPWQRGDDDLLPGRRPRLALRRR